MLKMFGVGFVILIVGLVCFGIHADRHPEAVHAKETKLEPVDRALGLCEAWTEKNSKLAVGEILEEHRLTGMKLSPGHGRVSIDYRSKGNGVLMTTVCEYAIVHEEVVLAKARSSLKIDGAPEAAPVE